MLQVVLLLAASSQPVYNVPVAVIAIAGSKGGTAKSTLARALLVEASRTGLRARLVDLDPQGTVADWARLRLSQGIDPAVDVVAASTLAAALQDADSIDYLVVDAPGRSGDTTLELARSADLVVLPTGCSSDDLRPMARLANELTAGGVPRERIAVVLCRVSTLGEERDARAYIEESALRAVASSLPERPAYRVAQNRGFSVSEVSVLSLRSRAERLVMEIGRLLE
jgi:chromosome partitioning protein